MRVGVLRVPFRPLIPRLISRLSVNARLGSWQLAQLMVSSLESFRSKKSRLPKSIFSRFGGLVVGKGTDGIPKGGDNSAEVSLFATDPKAVSATRTRRPTLLAMVRSIALTRACCGLGPLVSLAMNL